MSEKSPPSTSQRKLILLLLLTVVAVSGIGLYAVRTSRLRQNAAAPLVGTWRGEGIGNVLNLRPDGTARSRSSLPGQKLGYFEWTLDGNQLVIYQFGSRNSVGAWMARARRATVGLTPTDRYTVLESSPTQFTLRSAAGDVVTFTAAEDRGLETAP